MKREAEIVLYDHDKEIGRRTFPFKVRMNRAKTEWVISNEEDIVFGYPKIDEGEGGNITGIVVIFSCGVTWTPKNTMGVRYWGSSSHLTFHKGELRLGINTRINFSKLLNA